VRLRVQRVRRARRHAKPNSQFSIFNFQFAVPSPLRRLLRIAACAALLAGAAAAASASPGSLWKEESSKSMFADKRARAVGDIITILVQENNTTSKENSTQTSKSSSVDASLQTLLYTPAVSPFLTKAGQLPAMKFGGSQSFDGGGKINNSERITARIAVRVVDVLPNGNMIVEGRRETIVSGEKQEAVLRGVVRGEDVAANNTVLSYNVADASIKFTGKGTLSDNQRKGWLLRVWEKVTPF
jgi:flagellar L-ring protein precursor FlgH